MILAQEWILKVETHDPSDLEDPGEGWISLDRILAAALTNLAHGEVGRQITQATTTAFKKMCSHEEECYLRLFPVLRVWKQRPGVV